MKKLLAVVLLTVGFASHASVLNVASSAGSHEALINAPNQILGEFQTAINGKPVTLTDIPFLVDTEKPIVGVTLIDENGFIVAGPIDTFVSKYGIELRFRDPVTFPVGTHTYAVHGTLSSTFVNGDTFRLIAYPQLWSDSPKGYPVNGLTGSHVEVRPKEVIVLGTVSVQTGSLHISTDPTSPPFHVATGGEVNVAVGSYRLQAVGEPMFVSTLGLKLGTNAYPGDLYTVSIWDGSTKIGSAVFSGNNQWAVAIFDHPLYIPIDAYKLITVRADLAPIGIAYSGNSGDIIQIDFDDTYHPESTTAVGFLTGSLIPVTGLTAVAGVRMFKSYPTFRQDFLPTSGISDYRLIRFPVTASPSGPITMSYLSFQLAGPAVLNDWITLEAYADSAYSLFVNSYSVADLGTVTLTNGIVVKMFPRRTIPAGMTYYFQLIGDVRGTLSTTFLGTQTLSGSRCYDENATMMWSDNISQAYQCLWDNGYALPGLPPDGLTQVRTD